MSLFENFMCICVWPKEENLFYTAVTGKMANSMYGGRDMSEWKWNWYLVYGIVLCFVVELFTIGGIIYPLANMFHESACVCDCTDRY